MESDSSYSACKNFFILPFSPRYFMFFFYDKENERLPLTIKEVGDFKEVKRLSAFIQKPKDQ